MNTIKSFFSLILCIYGLSLSGQDIIKKYVQQKTVSVAAIDPANDEFSDFAAIGESIADAKIVMLGEQDHGDAPTFLAKSRLIKYLHEKKGFNVLAFESDFFGINYNWKFVKSGEMSLEDFVTKNISPIWTACEACDPLFKTYLPSTQKTGNPLQIAGFDIMMNTKLLLPLLDSLIQELKLPIAQNAEYRSQIYPLINSWYKYTADSSTNDKIVSYCRNIKTQMLDHLPKNDFWVQCVESFIQLNIEFRNSKKDFWKDMNTRDAQMAANLKWLSETKYPDEKIIVWAHNYHVSKYSGHYAKSFANAAITMGDVFTKNEGFKTKTYIVGFTSYQGTAGRLTTPVYKVEKPRTNAFENWIPRNWQFAFTDFKEFNASYPLASEQFYMSGATLGNNRYHSNYLAEWNKIFDGIFYIRDMYPCERK